jgi:hypothetical protein
MSDMSNHQDNKCSCDDANQYTGELYDRVKKNIAGEK